MVLGYHTDTELEDLNPTITLFLGSNYDVDRYKEAMDHLMLLTKADYVG